MSNNTELMGETDNTQVVTPWKVESQSGIDYMKLIRHFGCDPIDGKLIKRFEQVTNTRAHLWLRRGLFFSNKDLELCLSDLEQGKQIYLYTGRGPSSEAMHLGHMIPFMFTKYLQDALDAILIIQMSDDEKFAFKGHIDKHNLEHYINLTFENSKDIIACGFNPNKTFIFSNANNMNPDLYKTIVKIDSTVTGNSIRSIYGINLDNKIGEIAWPSKQCAPAFSCAFPDILTPDAEYIIMPDGTKHYVNLVPIRVLVPMAIDQKPYFSMARDAAEKLNLFKPAEIHSEFLPSLNGISSKMSSTGGIKPIFLTDNEIDIKNKIMASFSGGKDTKQLQMKYGANLHVDVAYQYLLYFCDDEERMKNIAHDYRSGKMLTGEIKKILIEIITKFVKEHQMRKDMLSTDTIKLFFNKDRRFDTSKSVKEPIELYTDEEYSKMGINFDRTYGATRPDGAEDYENIN